MPTMATIMSGIGFQEIMAAMGSTQTMGSSSGVQRKISRSETIHSGHFMVSEIDENEQTVEQESNEISHESDYERPVEVSDQLITYETNCKETTQTYVYGPKDTNFVSIDGSLTKLFECMTLAYSGKITSPRWKTFKGLKLKLKDKIRLNNIIWRAWHIQYIAGRNPIVCQFSSPVDSDRHKKAEAVILEGKYWKRRLATVTAEYQKWRLFHRKIGRPQTPSRPTSFDWENWTSTFNTLDGASDDYSMDFTDYSLFSQLLQPNLIDFPNPREIARSGMGAEFMQPGLVQLQPNLDDFMDTFEPLQELFFCSKNLSSLPTLPEESAVDNTTTNIGRQTSKMNQSILNISAPDLLNSLLCHSTTSSNSSSLQTYPMDDSMDDKSSSCSMGQNQNQISPELELTFKNNSLQSLQPVIPSPIHSQNVSLQTLSESTDQTMRAIDDLNSMQTKQISDQMYTHFVSPIIGAQNSVPLTQNQSSINSGIHSESCPQIATNFAQTDNSPHHSLSVTSLTQPFAVKSSPLRKKYINPNQNMSLTANDSNSSKFVVPKSLPIKQRPRERSISTPHINKENTSAIQSFPQMPLPVTAVSLTDIHIDRLNPGVERSLSLPVYTQEPMRRRSVASMQRTATAASSPTSGSVANISYQSQNSLQSLHQPINKMQIIGQKSLDNSPIHGPSYGSPQFVVSNAYDMSQGSPSTGSTLIARLLTSNSLNSISTDSSQPMFTNQSATHSMNLSNPVPNRPTTIDASCIGIRSGVTTVDNTNEKHHFLFAPKFREPNMNSMSGQLSPNIKQNFLMQSNSGLSSPVSTHPMPTIAKSRSSPVVMSKDSFVGIQSIPSPPSLCSPNKTKSKTTKDRIQYKEHRRVSHINAEQKRRCNIKNGFDTLKSLLPSISQNQNTKISKAAMLQKAAQHIRTLKTERQSQQEEYDRLKQQVESLNQTIGVFQNQLPATGVPISCQRSNQSRQLYDNYIRERTLQNWKFWIFSIIMESLWDSYNNSVSTVNDLEMTNTIWRWLEQTCSLINLRRGVLNSLRFLSTSTNILTDPKNLPEEAVMAVTKKEKQLTSLTS